MASLKNDTGDALLAAIKKSAEDTIHPPALRDLAEAYSLVASVRRARGEDDPRPRAGGFSI